MLERRAAANGVVFYESPLLRRAGVAHAFSTRIGGRSAGAFASLNLGNPNGQSIQDDYANVWANYARLQDAAGCGGRELCRVHQVHGNRVVRIERGRAFNFDEKADAIVSDDPARVASVRVADCVPVLLASADGRVVAAVHAGWRGVIAGVVPAAIERMRQIIGPADAPLLAAIGPCIGMDAFEVGGEVLAEFARVFGTDAPIRREADGKGHVDLRAAISAQLAGAGLSADSIDSTDRCTYRDVREFFSHRRENGITGRMAAIISPR